MRVTPLLAAATLLVAACEAQPEATTGPTAPASPEVASPEVASPAEPESVVVPDVVGAKLPRARRALREVGLAREVTRKASPEPAGTVLRQRPLGGLEVQPGHTVTLVVAKPQPPPPAPNDYSPPIPPGPDVDCAGGTGDGPRYEGQGDVPFGPFQVIGTDIYGLDGNGDGVGCED
jgi:hypothetical protein